MRKKIIDQKILNLASDTSNFGLVNKSKFFATHKNRKCGDKITIELQIKNNKILVISQQFIYENYLFTSYFYIKHINLPMSRNFSN